MSVFKRLAEKHKQRSVGANIRLQAGGAAEVILNRLVQGEEPYVRFNAQKPPKELPPDEFSSRIGQAALNIVSTSVRTIPVHYDHDASRQASTELNGVRHDMEVSHVSAAAGVILVFRRQELAA